MTKQTHPTLDMRLVAKQILVDLFALQFERSHRGEVFPLEMVYQDPVYGEQTLYPPSINYTGVSDCIEMELTLAHSQGYRLWVVTKFTITVSDNVEQGCSGLKILTPEDFFLDHGRLIATPQQANHPQEHHWTISCGRDLRAMFTEYNLLCSQRGNSLLWEFHMYM